MALGSGTRLGVYEIVGLLGRGGMGEVYRARDTKLGREVAIKVLPHALHDDPARLARFEREAKTLAALSHPNIAHVHGFDDSTGTPALIMELVEGATLADRIARGPLAVDDALHIAKQIAEGLEAAHEQGIIHRDLKPANIKVRDDGRVKILDFGLARATANASGGSLDVSNSPTITSPAILTSAGMILGTAAYMSPEQAGGRAADVRSDVWSFGCVLYEMLTGRRAFAGESVPAVLAAVLAAEPRWELLPTNTPAGVIRALRRCLTKDPKRRIRVIADVLLDLDDAPSVAQDSQRTPRPAHRIAPMVAVAIVALLAGAASTWWFTSAARRPSGQDAFRGRFSVALPADAPLTSLDTPAVAFSPDGRRIAFAAGEGITRLFVRDLESGDGKAITKTEGASSPFFSPDGRSIGFFQGGMVKRVSVDGGDPVTLCGGAGNPRGGAWDTDDTIAFTPAPGSAVFRVSANGGVAQPLTTLDVRRGEGAHHWPDFISGGAALVYTVATGTTTSWDEREIVVESLRTHERRVVAHATAARYVRSGHLLLARGGTILAVPFDTKRLQTTGTPIKVADRVMQSAFGAAQFGASREGSFAFVPGGIGERELVWMSRAGEPTPLEAPPQTYWSARLSPDERQLALGVEGPNYGIWIYDLSRGTMTRHTFEGTSAYPIWTPDGKRLTFNSTKSSGVLNLFWSRADGSGDEERLATSPFIQLANSWSPDGRTLAYAQYGETGSDIWMLSSDRSRSPSPFVKTPYAEGGAAFSPDGRWVAYVSTEGGPQNIYLRPFPGPGEKIQLSAAGGGGPVWSENGRELFYRNGDRMMAVDIGLGATTATAGKPHQLFTSAAISPTIFQPDYDVTRDGQRFVIIRRRGERPRITHVEIVVGALSGLKTF